MWGYFKEMAEWRFWVVYGIKKVCPIGHFSMPNGAVPARFLSKSYLL